jgi:23S rRNA (guanosine2251-2'-O)-methyltransferase
MSNIIYGFHSVSTYIKNTPNLVEEIYFDQNRRDKRLQELNNLAAQFGVSLINKSANELNALANGKTHQGIVAKVKQIVKLGLTQVLAELKDKQSAQILILDGITDPQNLGAIIRTAECFGVDAVILPKDNSAHTDNPIVAKTSSGAVNNLPIITVNNLNQAMDTLKEHEFWIAGTCLDQKSVNLFEFKFQGKLAWVMGSEGNGIRRLIMENCDYLVNIPLKGSTQSLNVSVATGIILAYTNYIENSFTDK